MHANAVSCNEQKDEFLKCYMPYIVSYATANQIINDLLAQEGENTPLARVSHVLSTGDLLMLHPKPMQRITKYALLLEVRFPNCGQRLATAK